jgi:hypothetical protein
MTYLAGSLAAVLLLAPAQDPLAARVRQTAYARMDLARAMARDEGLVQFVAAKNQKGETAAEIQQHDARWKTGGDGALRKDLAGNACAQRLRDLVKSDPFVLEAILMDRQGANVCITHDTSDYWQGDEAKWIKPVSERQEAFVDDPAFDQSAQAYAIQISVPVSQGGSTIGALCLTLKVPKPATASN